MKFIRCLLLFMLLVGVGRASFAADPYEGYVRLKSEKDGKYVRTNGVNLGYDNLRNITVAPTDDMLSQLWKIVKDGAAYHIFNVRTRTAVMNQGKLYQTHQVESTPTTIGTFYIRPVGAAGQNRLVLVSSKADFSGRTLWHHDDNGRVVNWENTSIVQNHWRVEPLTSEELSYIATAKADLDAQIAKRQAQEETMRIFFGGGIFRIEAHNGQVLTEGSSNALNLVASSTGSDKMQQIWVLERSGSTYQLRNASSGRFLSAADAGKALTTKAARQNLYIAVRNAASGFTKISWDGAFSSGKCLSVNASGAAIAGDGESSGSNNIASDWKWVPVTDATEDEVKNSLKIDKAAITDYQENKLYFIRSKAYPQRLVTMRNGENAAVGSEDFKHGNYAQIWMMEKVGDKWAFRNASDNRYLQNTTNASADMHMGSSPSGFSIKSVDAWIPSLINLQGSDLCVHTAKSQGYNLVGWYGDAEASQWHIEPADVTEAEYKKYKEDSDFEFRTHRAEYSAKLLKYFENGACVKLLPAYGSMTATALRKAMSDDGLPEAICEMAERVRSNTWNSADATANKYEKRFRLSEYHAYSHPQYWAWSNDLMRTAYNYYSQFTNPTGITAEAGAKLYVYVDRDAPADTEIAVQFVKGMDRSTTSEVVLKSGVNLLFAPAEAHLYIKYNINNTARKISEFPKVSVHIEGGRVNGCFDIEKDTDADWNALRTLKAYGFFTDNVIRIKSRTKMHSVALAGVEKAQDQGGWKFHNDKENKDYDKGLTDILKKWDEIEDMERDFLSVERFQDRFNCLMFNTSVDGSYAYTNGTYLGPGSLPSTFTYKEFAKGAPGDNAGNLWLVAHETGHHYQQLFNMAGCLESSNNLWSNIAVWRRGSNVSRGGSLQDIINRYNSGQDWFDMTIGDRMRLYWQLWLYYVELGHKPTFFKELIDKFRKTPMQNGAGTTFSAANDYLRFAQFCSDVAQEDLTEFFELWGFFRRTGEKVEMKYNDGYYDPIYPHFWINVKQADIDACKAHMAGYPKKRSNLFFIDERIRPVPATYEGHPDGAMRWATSPGYAPGNTAVLGDVGHYEDYRTGTTAAPKIVGLTDRTVRVQGEGIVGYKVYDKSGKLLSVSNRNIFELPAGYNIEDLVVKVGGGNGDDVAVIEEGKVKAEYKKSFDFDNTAHLILSTRTDRPEAVYHIACAAPYSGSSLTFMSADTKPVKESAAGHFAFFAGQNAGEYFLYDVDKQKWGSYNDTNNGRNKLVFKDNMGSSRPWKISIVQRGGKSVFAVSPAGDTGKLWNWNGGLAVQDGTIGLWHDLNDVHSYWVFPLAVYNVALTQGSNGCFSTLSLPVAASVPVGVSLYGVTPQSGNNLHLVPLTLSDGILPASTPVVVGASAPGIFSFVATSSSAVKPATGLEGDGAAVPFALQDRAHHDYYCLTRDKGTGEFLFRRLNTGVNIPALRAYYRTGAGAGAPALRLGNTVTSVSPATESAGRYAVPVYDLSGRRADRSVRGSVIIRGGQKSLSR